MSTEPEESPRRRVLVVSDEQETGRFLGRVLEDWGFETAICPVDEMAIEMASSVPPFDAVLGDSIGGPVVRRVRNLADPDRAATPIVILAAYDATDSNGTEALAAGASYHLSRPIVEHELVSAIRDVVVDTTPAETDEATDESTDEATDNQ
jgi:DNA-binding response OmpR family regulator